MGTNSKRYTLVINKHEHESRFDFIETVRRIQRGESSESLANIPFGEEEGTEEIRVTGFAQA